MNDTIKMQGYDKAYALMEEIYKNFSEEDKQWFENEEPIAMHSSLGRHIRNHAGLWQVEFKPNVVDGVDMSHDHPDYVSARVIEDFQRNLNNG